MKNSSSFVVAISIVALVGACADDAPPPGNPTKLWLGLDGSEIQVKLVGIEPQPF